MTEAFKKCSGPINLIHLHFLCSARTTFTQFPEKGIRL